jgi:hypothetical protein
MPMAGALARDGFFGLFGALDPSDGGNSSRFSLSGRWAQTDEAGSSKANFYVIKSSLNLWNNFTYFLSDPVNGDQFHQHDDRILGGINASHCTGWLRTNVGWCADF